MTDWSEVFSTLWNFTLQVIAFMSKLWEFLTNKITIGPVSFTPIYAFGGVIILTLLTMYLVKTFVPLA